MKTTTITREYDEQGRMVREIRTEVEYPPQPYVVDDSQWWQHPRKGWWQNPVISFTATTGTGQILMNTDRSSAEVAEEMAFHARCA